MIDYDGSQTYFEPENHYKAAIWSGFDTERRTAAIATARRILARTLDRTINDDEADYIEGDRTRDEYAIYEQALWMLENGQIADGSGSGPVPILTGATDTAGVDNKGVAGLYAPEALRWLGWNGVSVIRG
jgi:hypothetical protein